MNFIGTEMETGITQIRAIARIFRRKIVKSIVRSAIFMTMSIAVGVMLGLIIYMLSAILDFSITILIFIAFSALISICLGIRYAYNQAVDEYFRRIVMLRGYWNRFVFIFEFYDDYGYRYIRRYEYFSNVKCKTRANRELIMKCAVVNAQQSVREEGIYLSELILMAKLDS